MDTHMYMPLYTVKSTMTDESSDNLFKTLVRTYKLQIG